MGTIVCVYSEVRRKFFRIAAKEQIDLQKRRRLLGTPLRYCIGGDSVYLPAQDPDLPPLAQLCWARIRSEVVYEFDFHLDVGVQLPEHCTLDVLEEGGVDLGDRYIKRQREVGGALRKVDEFCAQTLIDGIAENPETLSNISKTQFEEVCAELFVRRGFKVDLFRPSKDGGIDFLAVDDTSNDPIVFAVQCKHPDVREAGKKRRALGLPVVQQIYGAAKAFGLRGGIAVTSATYTPDAKRFSDLRPSEIQVYGQDDVIRWLTQYRWNNDEKP